jgi:CheY-like chemotaxis protein
MQAASPLPPLGPLPKPWPGSLGLQPAQPQPRAQPIPGADAKVKANVIAAVSRRVLVIEDHVDTAEAIAACLAAAGHVVELARDGESGLAVARSFRPDVIICDIWLPGVDGYYVTRALRKDPPTADGYFVAISGVPFRVPAAVDFDEYLTKPVDGETLLAVMGRASER